MSTFLNVLRRWVPALFGVVLAAGAAPAGAQVGQPAARDRAVPAPLAVSSLLTDVAGRDGRLVAVGDRGHILFSTDAGASWTQAAVPTRALLTGVTLGDGGTGWAVGHDEVILRTADGGATWTLVRQAPETERPLLDVWFANARDGLAAGAYGSLLVTRDGGLTWETRTVVDGDDLHVNQIAAAPDGTVWLAAEAGRLYRSTNRGETWATVPSPYDGSWFGLLPRADGSLIVYGLRGHVARTTDGGATWTAVATSTDESLTCALDLGDGRFVVGGMAGTLLWGDASGTVRRQDLPDRKAIMALAPGPPGRLLVFGEQGVQRVEIPR